MLNNRRYTIEHPAVVTYRGIQEWDSQDLQALLDLQADWENPPCSW